MDNTLINLIHSFCFEINAFLNTKKRTELICTPNMIKIHVYLIHNNNSKITYFMLKIKKWYTNSFPLISILSCLKNSWIWEGDYLEACYFEVV